MTSQMQQTITRTIGDKAKYTKITLPSNLRAANAVSFRHLHTASMDINFSHNREYIDPIKVSLINDIYELLLGSYNVDRACIPDIREHKLAKFMKTFSVEYYHYIAETCTKINRSKMQYELMHVFGYEKQLSLIDELCDDVKWLMKINKEVETREEACANFVYFVTFNIDNRMPDKHLFADSFRSCRITLRQAKFKSIVLKASRDRKRIFVDTKNPREDLFFDNQYAAFKEYVKYYNARECFWDTQFIINEQKKYEALMDEMFEATAEDIDVAVE